MSLVGSETNRFFPTLNFIARILGNIGEAARPAVPALVSAMQKERQWYAVCKALASIGGDDALQAILDLLNSSDSNVRRFACDSLKSFLQHADLIVPRLIRLLENERVDSVCLLAIRALIDFGGGGIEAIPALCAVRDRLVPLPATPATNILLKEIDRCLAETKISSDPV